MIATELKQSRKHLRYSRKQMARLLQTPYCTYQDWERGKTRIPGSCAVAVQLLVEKNDRFFGSLRTGKLPWVPYVP